MKLKKRITSGIFCMAATTLLAVVLLFGACDTPLSPGDTLEYSEIAGGTEARIISLSYNGAPQGYTIPARIGSLLVTEIGPSAFYAASLSSISIPDTVERIGNRDSGSVLGSTLGRVFNPSIGSITIYVSGETPAGVFSSGNDGALYDDTGADLIYCPGGKSGTFTIPTAVTSIALDAFDDCRSITGFSLNNVSFHTLSGVLFNAAETTLIRFPPGRSGPYVYGDYPGTATVIAEKAFYGSRINSVEIPTGISSIGDLAFTFCKSLTSVTFADPTPPTMGLSLFYDNGPNRKIRVPAAAGSKALYLAALKWYEGALTIPIATRAAGAITITGDYASQFPVGEYAYVFFGNDGGSGSYIISSSSYTTDTTVSLSGYTDQGETHITPSNGIKQQVEKLGADVVTY